MDEAWPVGVEAALQGVEVDPGVLAGEQGKLGAAGVEFGRAALVALDVRFGMAEDRAVRRAEEGEGERVGGGAGWNQPNVEVVSKTSDRAAFAAAIHLSAP